MRLPSLLAASAVLTTAVVSTGCGPGLTIEGQLSSTAMPATDLPVSMAIAWYPSWFIDANGTRKGPPGPVVVTQKATFQGTYPLDFTFHADGPPPDAALVDLASLGGTGKAAYGVLIAFEDRNGNGKLDLAAVGAPSPDRVLGTSIADPSLPPPLHHHYVVYLDGHVAADDFLLSAHALEQGYNLMQVHSDYGIQLIPLENGIDLQITNTDAGGWWACKDADQSVGFVRNCGIDPLGGKYLISGALTGDRPVDLEIDDVDGFRTDATVHYNGQLATYDPQTASHTFEAPPGPGTLQIDIPGRPTDVINATVPGPVTLSLSIPTVIASGSTLTLSWERDPVVELYDIYVLTDDNHWLFHALTTDTSIETGKLVGFGGARVTVIALAPLAVSPTTGAYITPLNRHTERFTLR